MTPPTLDLIDVNVWVALSTASHVHFNRAKTYLDTESASKVGFCRLTMLGMMRLIMNPTIMQSAAYTSSGAWQLYTDYLSQSRVTFVQESVLIDDLLEDWQLKGLIHSSTWTDAAIAALAIKSGARLVTFDKGFQKYPGLEVHVLY